MFGLIISVYFRESCTAGRSYFDLLHQPIHFFLLLFGHLPDHRFSSLALLPLLFRLVGLVDTTSRFDGAANLISPDGLIRRLICEF